ncbi:hypothetical protein [Abyssalbus ytuae]|uniref:Uncharacterized protein n=1 Tax=Abyssalbus ytuae TaxID=2926907 RepID=A0A9E6ZRL9_9FLAO|nr:hypothetical protein [Abyssalbus ytuae]UOB16603.1 hypothetical protein MQE35_12760 [Abyssalbus ytuae]
MKIYVASSWRNEYQPLVVVLLRSLGHKVYDFRNPSEDNKGFSWSEIDPNWKDWTSDEYREALNHPIAEKGFKSDFDAMKWADCCLMVLPCGRSANTEAGWMKGAGKKVFIFQPLKQEPELMYKIYDGIITSGEDLYKQFNTIEPQTDGIDSQPCESCGDECDIQKMEMDADSNWFCPNCWRELSPVMKAEYEELVRRGEIDPED